MISGKSSMKTGFVFHKSIALVSEDVFVRVLDIATLTVCHVEMRTASMRTGAKICQFSCQK